MTWMFIGTLRLSYTWLDHKGYRGASHPVCIPPVAWLRDLVWLHCLPEHSSSVAGLSVQPVPWVRTLCPEKSWKPGTTFDHPVPWLSWALSLPAETWFGWGTSVGRTRRLWIQMGPAAWAISGPRVVYSKSIEATARTYSLPQAFGTIWTCKRNLL